MRIYVDEDTNPRIARFMPDHTFETPNSMGWKSLKNGRLLAALHGTFDALLTHDDNMDKQQNLLKFAVRVIVLDMPGRLLPDYEAIAPEVENALRTAKPGTCTRIRLRSAS